MIQDMTFIKKNGMLIRGRMYRSQGGAQKKPLVIFAHGFGATFRDLMHHGTGFAEAGICCLFFDFCGGGMSGTSDGTMEDMTVRTECEDLKTVIEEVKKLDYIDSRRIFLQGESMGGLVAALVAAECPEDIRAMVLWYPAFIIPEDAKRRYEAGDRQVFGITLSGDFDREAKDINVYEEISAYTGPVLMIHGDRDEVVPVGCSEKAESVYKDAKLIIMHGAGHGYDGEDSVAAREKSIFFISQYL